MRLISMSFMFVALRGIGFAVLAVDFILRFLYCFLMNGGESISVNVFIQAVLAFGSDASDGPNEFTAFLVIWIKCDSAHLPLRGQSPAHD